jgi:dsRNA-specific ribonuclease
MTKGIQVPEYKMTKYEGPPHAKLFIIMCKVSELELVFSHTDQHYHIYSNSAIFNY